MDTNPQWRIGDPAPPPLPHRSEADVVAHWQDGPPLVSVLCPTYQHIGFVEDALRGFLGQDTEFPFEVIVRDDASTDGTADIVRDYAERFPGVVRAVLEPVNSFGRIRPGPRLMQLAKGRLFALCEGDDYWIDADKLTKQVARLSADPSVAVSHHGSLHVLNGVITAVPPQEVEPRTSADRLRTTEFGLAARTMCFRAEVGCGLPFSNHVLQGDKFLTAQLGLLGDAVYEPDVLPAIYRLHPGGVWSLKNDREHRAARATTSYWMAAFFNEHGDLESSKHHLIRSIEVAGAAFLADGLDPRPKLALRFAVGWIRSLLRRALEGLRLRGRKIPG